MKKTKIISIISVFLIFLIIFPINNFNELREGTSTQLDSSANLTIYTFGITPINVSRFQPFTVFLTEANTAYHVHIRFDTSVMIYDLEEVSNGIWEKVFSANEFWSSGFHGITFIIENATTTLYRKYSILQDHLGQNSATISGDINNSIIIPYYYDIENGTLETNYQNELSNGNFNTSIGGQAVDWNYNLNKNTYYAINESMMYSDMLDHLILHTPMDEPSWSGSVGEVNDYSPYFSNGISQNGATTTSDAIYGEAGIFDGSNDYVKTPYHSGHNRLDENISIAFWYKPHDISDCMSAIITKKESFVIEQWTNQILFAFRLSGGYLWKIVLSNNNVLVQDAWHFIVCSYNYEDGLMAIWINGTLEGSNIVSGGVRLSNNEITIGADPTSSYNNCTIDEVMIFDSVLTQNQIFGLYNSTIETQSNITQIVEFNNILHEDVDLEYVYKVGYSTGRAFVQGFINETMLYEYELTCDNNWHTVHYDVPDILVQSISEGVYQINISMKQNESGLPIGFLDNISILTQDFNKNILKKCDNISLNYSSVIYDSKERIINTYIFNTQLMGLDINHLLDYNLTVGINLNDTVDDYANLSIYNYTSGSFEAIYDINYTNYVIANIYISNMTNYININGLIKFQIEINNSNPIKLSVDCFIAYLNLSTDYVLYLAGICDSQLYTIIPNSTGYIELIMDYDVSPTELDYDTIDELKISLHYDIFNSNGIDYNMTYQIYNFTSKNWTEIPMIVETWCPTKQTNISQFQFSNQPNWNITDIMNDTAHGSPGHCIQIKMLLNTTNQDLLLGIDCVCINVYENMTLSNNFFYLNDLPSSSHPSDQIIPKNVMDNASQYITWNLYAPNGGENYTVSRNGTEIDNGSYINGETVTITIYNQTGIWNYTIWLNDTSGNNYTDEVLITIILPPAPISNHPINKTYYKDSLGKMVNWTLQDSVGSGFYQILRNGTVSVSWTTWTNNTPILLTINTSVIGIWNYTIQYNNSYGVLGIQDTILIRIIVEPPDWEIIFLVTLLLSIAIIVAGTLIIYILLEQKRTQILLKM